MLQKKGHVGIVKLLLNAFSENERDKLIEYVMKENQYKCTSLHFAVYQEDKGIVDALSEEEKDTFNEYVIKEHQDKEKNFT